MSSHQHPSPPANRQVSTSESLLLNHSVLCDEGRRPESEARDVLVGGVAGRDYSQMERPCFNTEHDTFGETEAQRGHVVPRVHIVGFWQS